LWTRFLKENNLNDKFKMISHEDDGIVNADKKFDVNNFNKLCIPEDYMPEEEEKDEDDNAVEEKEEAKPISNSIPSVYSQEDDAEVKKIKDQLSNTNQKLSKKDKKKLNKRLKNLIKKNEKTQNNESGSDDDSDCTEAIDSLNLN
jgi:hypothetical protein